MPLYLLKIKKRKWDRLDVPWLKPNDIPADPLSDLNISEGSPSVWHIEDDRSNLDLVIIALAANRERIDIFEYGLFNQEIIHTIGLKVQITPGKTPINLANSWHRDLIEMTTNKAAALVNMIFYELEKQRLLADEVQVRILDAIEDGYLGLDKLNKRLSEKLRQL